MGLASVAGCLGSDDSDETDDLEDEIEKLESREDELEDEIEALADREETLEDDLEEVKAREAQLEEEQEDFVEERLRILYEAAEGYHDLGRQEYVAAVDYLQDQEWTSAAKFFGVAFRSYDTAQELTFKANELATDEEYAEAREVLQTSNTYAELMKEACDSYSVAAQYYANGDRNRGDDEVATGDQYFEDADQRTFYSLREFEATL
ncbi:hypothetical protein C493_13968 [Natronolimnohabitans innermongolicus JCM 12255]|uniref:Uncharacterized protein n=1 Tax=Natronolimnohabitans innermongolicus JCM 12255 TaxID=1227499 RepID=L9WZ54_9EURY|nr:hypothetical protein C493_13968 [Natronolimnohabitans innermongolicus JCM 12255]